MQLTGAMHTEFSRQKFVKVMFTFAIELLPRPVEGIASLLRMAAESLRHPDGHIYYLGTDLFGVLGYEPTT